MKKQCKSKCWIGSVFCVLSCILFVGCGSMEEDRKLSTEETVALSEVEEPSATITVAEQQDSDSYEDSNVVTGDADSYLNSGVVTKDHWAQYYIPPEHISQMETVKCYRMLPMTDTAHSQVNAALIAEQGYLGMELFTRTQDKRITLEEVMEILDTYGPYKATEKILEIHGGADVEMGSGVAIYEFWLDDQGKEFIYNLCGSFVYFRYDETLQQYTYQRLDKDSDHGFSAANSEKAQ